MVGVNARALPMRLTPELVAQVMLKAVDLTPGPMPEGRRPATEADHEAAVMDILAGAPGHAPVWIFAYGSLIWNPEFDYAEQRIGVARGWHRSFCLGWDRWYRGSDKRPGLMLALDRGGQCKGLVFRLPSDTFKENLLRLVRREIRLVPHAFPPRWIDVATAAGSVRAITFVIDRTSGAYVGRLPLVQVADVLAVAAGKLGSMAEYLHNTVVHLEECGIRDRNLWRLQAMVAERIVAASVLRSDPATRTS